MKSNEEWSSQLWTQFMQLRKKPEKKFPDFILIYIFARKPTWYFFGKFWKIVIINEKSGMTATGLKNE